MRSTIEYKELSFHNPVVFTLAQQFNSHFNMDTINNKDMADKCELLQYNNSK